MQHVQFVKTLLIFSTLHQKWYFDQVRARESGVYMWNDVKKGLKYSACYKYVSTLFKRNIWSSQVESDL